MADPNDIIGLLRAPVDSSPQVPTTDRAGDIISQLRAPTQTSNKPARVAAHSNPAPEPDTISTINRESGIVARALYPGLIGAGAGAALGIPGGPAGMAAGVVAGGLALPVAELGTAGVNAVSSALGSNYRMGSPTDYVENLMTKAGLPTADTTGERMLQSGASALGNAAVAPAAFANLAKTAASPVVRGVAEQLAAKPVAQLATAAPAGAAAQGVSEKTGVPALGTIAAGLVGATPAFRAGTLKGMTIQELRDASQSAYRQSENSGVVIKPAAFEDLVNRIHESIDPTDLDKEVHPKTISRLAGLRRASDSFMPNPPATADVSPEDRAMSSWMRVPDTSAEDQAAAQNAAAPQPEPLSLKKLDTIKQGLRESWLNAKVARNDADARHLQGMITKVDDFITNLRPDQLDGGDPNVAVPALRNAQDLWKRQARMDQFADIFDASEDLKDPNIVKLKMRALVKNRDKFDQFTPDEKTIIKKMANNGALDVLGSFAPGTGLYGKISAGALGLIGGGGYLAHDPKVMIAAGATAAGGGLAKYAANRARMRGLGDLQNTISLGGQSPSFFDRNDIDVLPPTVARGGLTTLDDERAKRARQSGLMLAGDNQ